MVKLLPNTLVLLEVLLYHHRQCVTQKPFLHVGHVIFFFFSNFNIGGYFFGAFLCVKQMLENTFSSKMPFSHPNFTFKFTKGSAQKYKGKWIDLVFCFLCFKIDRNCWFCSPRSICLLDAVLLIPILLWLMTFYVIWHMS